MPSESVVLTALPTSGRESSSLEVAHRPSDVLGFVHLHHTHLPPWLHHPGSSRRMPLLAPQDSLRENRREGAAG